MGEVSGPLPSFRTDVAYEELYVMISQLAAVLRTLISLQVTWSPSTVCMKPGGVCVPICQHRAGLHASVVPLELGFQCLAGETVREKTGRAS